MALAPATGGEAFASEQACVSYAAQGGTLKRAQKISFTSTNPSPAPVGPTTYTPTATANPSRLSVTFALAASSTGCSLRGEVVSFTAAGTCVINANQPANATYAAAPQVQQSITVVVAPLVSPSQTPRPAVNTPGWPMRSPPRPRGIATLTAGVLDVPSGVTASVTNLKITGGNFGFNGGGIRNAKTLSITKSIVTANQSGGDGGGIWTPGGLTITDSVISFNRAIHGGGIGAGPGAAVSVTDSEISSNTGEDGGGISAGGTEPMSR